MHILFLLADVLQKFWKTWPAPAVPLPTYLPTYPTYGKLKKKSLDGGGEVYYTNKVMAGGTLLQPQSFL